MTIIRDYRPADEEGWLRCRVLSFLHTAYFDDVEPLRPPIGPMGFGLVAESDGGLDGILDVSIEDELATIDTIAVHPDRKGRGVGTALFTEAARRASEAGATTIDAWTRDDEPTLSWYRSRGFLESDHYLHVYANRYTDKSEPERAIATARQGLAPVIVFAHAKLDREDELRREFCRVHVCRRFSCPL